MKMLRTELHMAAQHLLSLQVMNGTEQHQSNEAEQLVYPWQPHDSWIRPQGIRPFGLDEARLFLGHLLFETDSPEEHRYLNLHMAS